MSKNILIFSDGTGQAGGLKAEQRLSNIYKIYRASQVGSDNVIDPNEQVAFYDFGLGTDVSSTGFTQLKKKLSKFLGSVTGRGITTNIIDCYEAILNHYEPGDRVFLFGFSRGAYTARCVANVITLCGVPVTNGSGQPLPRFHKQTRSIANEAVKEVYEHGAGLSRAKFQDERKVKAKRFRDRYKSDVEGHANVSPHFIGVFDTVAALGAKKLLRFLMTIGAIFSIAGVTALIALFTTKIFGWDFISTFILFSIALVSLTLWKSLKSSFKVIWSYPKPWRFRFHFAKWKMKNYDRGLDSSVKFIRHALAIDETRKDFDRVGWGNKNTDYTSVDGEPEKFIQLWFAGNHSDIGGSYPENESRLSDIALEWMISEATSIPNPLIVNRSKLNLFPSANAMQHCEVERVKQLYPNWIPKKLRFSWPEKHRNAASGAPYHPSVIERLNLPNIIKYGHSVPYRPEALKFDPELKHLYSNL